MNAKELIKKERARQIAVEGWTEEHDDEHTRGEMAAAAHCYETNDPTGWPWDKKWWKPGKDTHAGRIRRLVKAGALIRAERDRLKKLSLMIVSEIDDELSQTEAAAWAKSREESGHR